MSALRIGVIGAGNIAQAITKGILKAGVTAPANIIASDLASAGPLLERFKSYGCVTTNDNREATEGCDVTILAVKPAVVPIVLKDIAGCVSPQSPLVASTAMGVSLAALQAALPLGSRVVRCMPNTPASVGLGASVYVPGHCATAEDEQLTMRLLDSVGLCMRLTSEAQLDVATGLSGAGPAFTFVMIEALADGGVKMGLPRDVAMRLAAQTLMGAAKMVLESKEHPGALKDSVCSPGGCSIAGVAALEAAGVRGGLISAVEAAASKAMS